MARFPLASLLLLLAAGACSREDEPDRLPSLDCPATAVICDGRCTFLDSDRDNCGACGVTCTAGCPDGSSSCVNGTCVNDCQDGCVDILCVDAGLCSGSNCSSPCDDPQVFPDHKVCDGQCVDTKVDPKNCGGCGSDCSGTPECPTPGSFCQNGVCSLTCSGGACVCGGTCVNINLDPEHCGGCDKSCKPGELCAMGKCELWCAGSVPTNCNNTCVDTQSDPDHCGMCENPCAMGVSCCNGMCGVQCPGGMTACGCECADFATNPKHCGGCNKPCAMGQACVMGACQP